MAFKFKTQEIRALLKEYQAKARELMQVHYADKNPNHTTFKIKQDKLAKEFADKLIKLGGYKKITDNLIIDATHLLIGFSTGKRPIYIWIPDITNCNFHTSTNTYKEFFNPAIGEDALKYKELYDKKYEIQKQMRELEIKYKEC